MPFSPMKFTKVMGTLTGTVAEFGTGLPVQGATITAGEYTGRDDATGHAVLAFMPEPIL